MERNIVNEKKEWGKRGRKRQIEKVGYKKLHEKVNRMTRIECIKRMRERERERDFK